MNQCTEHLWMWRNMASILQIIHGPSLQKTQRLSWTVLTCISTEGWVSVATVTMVSFWSKAANSVLSFSRKMSSWRRGECLCALGSKGRAHHSLRSYRTANAEPNYLAVAAKPQWWVVLAWLHRAGDKVSCTPSCTDRTGQLVWEPTFCSHLPSSQFYLGGKLLIRLASGRQVKSELNTCSDEITKKPKPQFSWAAPWKKYLSCAGM